jgi:hypothetical protein
MNTDGHGFQGLKAGQIIAQGNALGLLFKSILSPERVAEF